VVISLKIRILSVDECFLTGGSPALIYPWLTYELYKAGADRRNFWASEGAYNDSYNVYRDSRLRRLSTDTNCWVGGSLSLRKPSLKGVCVVSSSVPLSLESRASGSFVARFNNCSL
jgi:hypothetical protein